MQTCLDAFWPPRRARPAGGSFPPRLSWLRRLALLAAAWLAWTAVPALAATPGGAMRAERLAPGETLRLDGRLDHPAWQRAPVYDAFVEKDPNNGAPPPQATRVQLLFDDLALYVGITLLDSDPSKIRRALVRHDQVLRTQPAGDDQRQQLGVGVRGHAVAAEHLELEGDHAVHRHG